MVSEVFMIRITLDLDDQTSALVAAGARASGMSEDHWVSEIVRRYVSATWSAECRELAGAFPDFPLVEDEPSLEVRCDDR